MSADYSAALYSLTAVGMKDLLTFGLYESINNKNNGMLNTRCYVVLYRVVAAAWGFSGAQVLCQWCVMILRPRCYCLYVYRH